MLSRTLRPRNCAAVVAIALVCVPNALAIRPYQSVPAGVVSIVPAVHAPASVAVDAAGNLYIADTQNNAVKEWHAGNGQVSTLVSTGLAQPGGVAVDSLGNVYIADTNNNAIKQWSIVTGLVTTLVSSGLNNPQGVAVDGAGNIYIADTGNSAIKEWQVASGEVTTLLSGVSSTAVAADTAGNIYFTPNGTVEELNVASGQLTTLVSSASILPPPFFGTISPSGVAVDSAGNVYIADQVNGAIWEWNAGSGQITGLFSNSQGPIGVFGVTLNYPFGPAGIAVDSAGNVYVADKNNNAIEKVPGPGSLYGVVSNLLSSPWGVATDAAGNAYIADTFNGALREWNANSSQLTTLVLGQFNGQPSPLGYPNGVALDSSGNVYLSTSASVIEEWSPNSGQVTTLVSNGTGIRWGIAVDSAGNVYTANTGNNSIDEWNASSGQLITLVSSGLSNPQGVAVDALGNVYIGDTGNSAVKEWNATTGQVTTLVSSGLSYPQGVAVDALGNVYIADTNNNAIKEWNVSSGQVTTLVSGLSSSPNGIAVDAEGNLFFSLQSLNEVDELPNAQVNVIDNFTEQPDAGSDSVVSLIPATTTLNAVSDQTWLTITGQTTFPGSTNYGVVSFSFTANTGTTARVASIWVLGVRVPVTQLASQTITFGTIPQQMTGTPLTLTATTSSNLPVTYTSGTPSVCVVSGSTVTFLSAGTCSITSSQSGNGNYAAASVTQSFSVLSAITFGTSGTSFGSVNVGSNATGTVSFSINLALTLGGVRTNGDYSILSNSCAPNTALASGTTCTLQIQFTPVAPGVRSAPLIAFDSNGNNYSIGLQGTGVASAVAFTPGIIGTVAGTPGQTGYSGDGGAATSALLGFPYGVALDNAGHLYISDTTNSAIREVNGQGSINTIVGNGTVGYSGDGGLATSALIANAWGTATDIAGNLYIADTNNNVIRKVDANGIITTVAGNHTPGLSGDGGPATSAQLNGPAAVTLDGNGNLYIADAGNNVVRKVDTNGMITTVAGDQRNGSAGYSGDGGPATSAQLSGPEGVALDSAGNLYIADDGNQLIRKVSTNGIITTVAGTPGSSGFAGDGGPATSAQLAYPFGIALDSAGDMYIACNSSSTIRKVDVNGIITTVAGSPNQFTYGGDGGPATSAQLNLPFALALDGASNIYIADAFNHLIRQVNVTMSSLAFTSANTPQSVVVSNVGNAPMNFSAFGFPAAFQQVTVGNDCVVGTPLNPGQSCNLGVQVVSGSVSSSGTLTITDNALSNSQSQQTVALSYVAAAASQTITFATVPTQVVGVPLTLSATASSGLAVTYTSNSTGVCTISGSSTANFLTSGTCSITASQPGNANYTAATPVTQTFQVTPATPIIQWATPAAITYGTALSATQLNATATYNGASVAGTFVYTPAKGTVLGVGNQTLSVSFKPTQTASFTGATASVTLQVNQATPKITWPKPAAITYPTALSSTQLDATASVPGTFVYSPTAGTVLAPGAQTLSVTFTPTDGADYTTSTASVALTVNKLAPTLTWATPAAVTYGTALSTTQLNATASVPGTFVYSPAAGAIPAGGADKLSVTFTPTNSTDYSTATASVTLQVNPATPTIQWATPVAITYGTALSATQLNAATTFNGATVAGTYVYTPAKGAVLAAGSQTLSVVFTPTNTANYNGASASVKLQVNQATPKITWATPAAITYPTALSSTQLNATASVPGTFVYSPAAGTVLAAGTQTLSATFTPTDTTDYATSTASVKLTVNKLAPTITWATPAAVTYGTALSSTQLNATASVPGTFVYSPAAGAIPAGGADKLSVTFTPTNSTDYSTATASVTLQVSPATPTIQWATPAAITYGTALSATQLNATATYNGATVAGTYVYTPAKGTVLGAGSQTLAVTFTPTNTANYNSASASVKLQVNQATPKITWATPAAITHPAPLTSTQLDATASVPGTFVYSPPAGTVLAAGTQTLSVTFTPTDATDYATAKDTVTLTVKP